MTAVAVAVWKKKNFIRRTRP